MLADVQHAIEALPRDEPLIVLADFDGTLAEFHPNPAAPMLTEIRREWLRDIAAQGLTFAGIVSGRRVADLRTRTQLPPHGSICAGLHGMEIESRPCAAGSIPISRRARAARAGADSRCSKTCVDRCPALMLEDKHVSVAVHVAGRGPDCRAAALALADACAEPWLASGRLRRLDRQPRGRVPARTSRVTRATRRDGLPTMSRRRPGSRAWVVFVGDDVTDEDAFRAIDRGLGVLVGIAPSVRRRTSSAASQMSIRLLAWLAARIMRPAQR